MNSTHLRCSLACDLWLVGAVQVWQFTSEFIDAHGRAVLLRGGSHYLPCCDPSSDTCPSGAACRSTRWGGNW
jgi:hypothetical protein